MNLEIRDLDVAYGRTQVLFGVDLDVPHGALVCLMGRNGVGKSTLLNAVMGVVPVRGGDVRCDGDSIRRLATHERARRGIAYVPQGHQVFPQLTVRENLHVVMEGNPRATREARDEVLDLFPALVTLATRPAGLLSGGEARQLAIGRALLTRPELLILDEPTEGIQPSIIAEIEETIARLHATTGMTILLVEQYVEFALRLAEHYAVMEGGRIDHAGDTRTADVAAFEDLLSV